MPVDFETVAIPVVKGLDVNTAARLVDPGHMLEAENVRIGPAGASKRRGHVAYRVRSNTPIPPGITVPEMDAPALRTPYGRGDRGLPSTWLFGWGYLQSTVRSSLTTRNATSPHPDACLLFGSAQRDDETLVWNGYQLIGATTVADAVMPALRSSTIAKCSQSQTLPDVADNGTIRVVAWIDPVTTSTTYSVFDSATGGTHVKPTTFTTGNPAQYVRCIPVGRWVHVLTSYATGEIQCVSINDSSPLARTVRTLGTCAKYFDCRKIDETKWVLLRNTGSGLQVNYLGSDAHTARIVNTGFAAVYGVTMDSVSTVAIASHPTTSQVCVVWRGTKSGDPSPKVFARCFESDGTPYTTVEIASVTEATRPVTVAEKWLLGDESVFDVYWDDLAAISGKNILRSSRVTATSSSPEDVVDQYNLTLASHAFRVGDRTFVWSANASTYQRTWLLLDEKLLPVGHAEYATANCESTGNPFLPSVNWSGDAPVKDILTFHCALGYRVRVAVDTTIVGVNAPAVYAEPSIKFAELDFLPPLRSAQAGRSTYFAGAQLWAYDGTDLHESGFHLCPEATVTDGSAGGALVSGAKYRYRIDACYRNAQGEEVRSHSLYTDEFTVTANGKAVLTWKPIPTRRGTSCYYLIFRNEGGGVQWYLINSRDPSSSQFVANVPGYTLQYTDAGTVSDAALLQLEQYPGNGGFSWITPIAAPACEIVVAGVDRLWVAGGELPPGQIAPSRLFQPGEAPAFNPLVNVQIDRNAEPITAIGFVGEVVAVFRRNQTYVQEGAGPDNSSNGSWPTARLAVAGLGAVSQESLSLIPGGLAFQSPSGFRLLGPGGQLAPIGLPIDRLAKDFEVSGSFISYEDREVRWYSRSAGALVYNYEFDVWTTWTCNAAGVTRDPSGLAVLADPEGDLHVETEGWWRDGQSLFRMRVRFAWLRGGNLVDFQRVRRVAGVGEAAAPHTIRLAAYYDEQDFEYEVLTWNYPADADNSSWNTDSFGNASFGAGDFGDTDA